MFGYKNADTFLIEFAVAPCHFTCGFSFHLWNASNIFHFNEDKKNLFYDNISLQKEEKMLFLRNSFLILLFY